MAISGLDFAYVRDLLRERTAIELEPDRTYLVEARLQPLARREGLGSTSEVVARLRTRPFGPLHQRVVEAMTTNETLFFRDIHPFQVLKHVVLPELIQRRAAERHLNIWSAACSTGQEPYSIAMLIREHFPVLRGCQVSIMGSDISGAVLARAQAGLYSQIEVNRGLPTPLLQRYFTRKGLHWQLGDEIRRAVEWREFNLANAWPVLPEMDLVFMRNVLIYFHADARRKVLGNLHAVLKPDGYLFLGSSETTLNLDESFERIQAEQTGYFRRLR